MKPTKHLPGITVVGLVSTVFSLICTPLAANEITQQDITEQNTVSDAKLIDDAGTAIEEWADRFLDIMGLDDFGEQDGKIFLFSSAPVTMTDLDPEYGKALVLAYDRAFMNVQEQYVMMRFGQVIVEKSRSFYADDSTNAREVPIDFNPTDGIGEKLLMLFKKSLEVADKKLDKELLEMGVDPRELENMPITKKKTIFEDTFFKKTIEQASGEISGLIPVQTAVMKDKQGQTRVGVIAVVSAKTQQIARDMRYQRSPGVKGKGSELSTLLPDNKEAFLGEFGTRLAYDEDGRPSIISYGVASFIDNAGDSYINQRKRDSAREQASGNADAAIAEYVNGFLSTRSEQTSGEEVAQILEREMKPDALTVEKTIKNIIDKRNELAESSARMELKGVSTVKRPFFLELGSGANMVFVVRAWKYSTLDAMNDFERPPETIAREEEAGEHQDGAYEGNVINSIDDF